jgi:hypothetical protein
MTMAVTARLGAAAAAAAVLAGCSSDSSQLPPCSTGHGRDGSSSTLSVHQDGDHFTGTYLNTPPGPGGVSIRYDVTGTASGGHLVSTWSVGSLALRVTGHYTSRRIVLDNPGGKFSTTVFTASKGCPG